jgi:hypothetical protein
MDMKNFILFGGNFATNVIKKTLYYYNNNIIHYSSSKQRPKGEYLNNSYIFLVIPPENNLKFFENNDLSNAKVFIEKPLAPSLADALKIEQICKDKNIEIFIDFTFNFIKSFQYLFNEIKLNNEIFKSYNICWNSKTRQTNFKNNWKHSSKKGGGGLNNFISHIISIIDINFFEISSLKSSLSSKHIGNFIFNDCAGDISIKHTNGIVGNLKYDIFSKLSNFEFVINTDKNKYVLTNNEKIFFKSFSLYKNNIKIFSENHEFDFDPRVFPITSSTKCFIDNNIFSKKLDIKHAVRVQKILELIQQSSIKRKELYV